MSGRHKKRGWAEDEPTEPRTGLFGRRAVRTPLIVLGALGLIGVSTIAVRAVNADANGCSSSGIQLTVAADPAIYPAINEIGARWSATNPMVGDDCVRVQVISQPSHELANSLGTWAGGTVDVAAKPAPTPSDADLPAAWIPDSSYWLGRMRAVDKEMFEASTPSVASSPVVLAMPETVARSLAEKVGKGLDAAALRSMLPAGQLKLGVVEPRRDTAGMIGAMMLQDAVVASAADLPSLAYVYRNIGGPVHDTASLWNAFKADGGATAVNAAPVSEQAVLAFNTGAPAAPMAAIPLAEAQTLDFPYAVRSSQARTLAAAAALFRNVLTSGQYQSVLAENRLRAADGTAPAGFPTGHGVSSAPIAVQPLTDMAKVRAALTVWVAAKTPSRVISLVDATSSMGKPMTANGHTEVRIQVMRGAAEYGLKMFTDDSLLGLWVFAGGGHVPLVPLDTLTPPQRAKLNAAVNQARPQPTDICPLYKSIIAGYRELLKGYDPAFSNTLVVFTDGRDNTDASLKAVQRELEQLANITKPIRVVLLGIGPDVKMTELQALAQTTGGVAVQVSDPTQMQSVFLKALLT